MVKRMNMKARKNHRRENAVELYKYQIEQYKLGRRGNDDNRAEKIKALEFNLQKTKEALK